MSDKRQRFETLSVHAGYTPDPTTRAVVPPIFQTVAYAFDSAQHGADLFDLKVAGNIYTRIMNPTQAVLEARLAALEGGVGALALASGQAAITYAIQTIAEAGDNIVSSTALYGGTYNLFAHTLPQYGIETLPLRMDRICDNTLAAAGVTEETVRLCVSIEHMTTCAPTWTRRWRRRRRLIRLAGRLPPAADDEDRTTGRPKGAMPTHRSLTTMGLTCLVDVDVDAAERFAIGRELGPLSTFAAPTILKRLVDHAETAGLGPDDAARCFEMATLA